MVVKIPLIPDGLKAVRALTDEGVRTNVTLCFSATQGLLAAKAGATYISPFLGRIDDTAWDGMELIGQLRTIYDNYGFDTEILAASIRHPKHVMECAMLGADVATIPLSVILQLTQASAHRHRARALPRRREEDPERGMSGGVRQVRRDARSAGARRAVVSLAVIGALVVPLPASAEGPSGPAGLVQGLFLASPAPDFGGAAMLDLWYPIGIFRIGGFFGVGSVPSPTDAYNRTFMPAGLSLALEINSEAVGLSLRARGGVWGGATQAVKITAGGFVGGGAWLLFRLSELVSLDVGVDVWGLLGAGETAIFAPGVGVTWTPNGGT